MYLVIKAILLLFKGESNLGGRGQSIILLPFIPSQTYTVQTFCDVCGRQIIRKIKGSPLFSGDSNQHGLGDLLKEQNIVVSTQMPHLICVLAVRIRHMIEHSVLTKGKKKLRTCLVFMT